MEKVVTVIFCDRCGVEVEANAPRMKFPSKDGRLTDKDDTEARKYQRVDFCVSCLGAALDDLLWRMDYREAELWERRWVRKREDTHLFSEEPTCRESPRA